MRIDLHLHSRVSDGDLTPATLVATAAAAGLDVIALTDHDTAAGVPEALDAARDLPVRVVPGLEISTRWGEHEFHVLGYWIDPLSEPILRHQEASVHRRTERMQGMVERLRGMGIPISYDDVLAAAGPGVQSIGRPHLARALLAGGHTRFYGEAFARYISDAGPAFVAQSFPSPEAAIELIHSAGGVASWAHPPLELVGELLPAFVGWGLDGVECYRPSLLPVESARLLDLARTHGLMPTGGSDWHGAQRAALGEFHLGASEVAALLARGGVGGGEGDKVTR